MEFLVRRRFSNERSNGSNSIGNPSDFASRTRSACVKSSCPVSSPSQTTSLMGLATSSAYRRPANGVLDEMKYPDVSLCVGLEKFDHEGIESAADGSPLSRQVFQLGPILEL